MYIPDGNVPPLPLPLGRVMQLYVARDSIVSVVKVKTEWRITTDLLINFGSFHCLAADCNSNNLRK